MVRLDEKLPVNPFHPSVLVHIETSHCITYDWFLYETHHWAKMVMILGLSSVLCGSDYMSHIAVESALVLLMLVEYAGESTLASTNGRVTHSLILLNPCIIIPMLLVFLEFIGVTFEDAHLSKLNWFFLILMDWLLALLKGCRIFWSLFQDVISLLCQQFLSSTMIF